MFRPEQRELERFRFHQGQMLRSEDFRDQQTVEAQLRAWHNRALHSTYGVARNVLEGLAVTADGADKVVVKPGVAYDGFGRELRLGREKSLDLPDPSEEMFLVIRSRLGDVCARNGQILEACLTSHAPADASEVELVWLPVKGFSIRDGVPLARWDDVLDPTFIVQLTRPLARPRIASGATIPGATDWNAWEVKRANRDYLIKAVSSFQVSIDTSSAGFAIRPAYFAALQGQLSFTDEETGAQFIGLSLGHIDQATNNGFVFRFFVTAYQVAAGKKPRPVGDLRDFLLRQNAYVYWIGIEGNEVGNEHH